MKLRDIVAELNIEGEDGTIGGIMADLDTEDRALLTEMLYDTVNGSIQDQQGHRPKYKYTGRDVSRALNRLGYDISERSIQRHRQDKRESQ